MATGSAVQKTRSLTRSLATPLHNNFHLGKITGYCPRDLNIHPARVKEPTPVFRNAAYKP